MARTRILIVTALLFVACVITACHGSLVGGDGEAEELIAVADETGPTSADHFVGVQLKPNPNKRSAYHVLESPGLRSHFSRTSVNKAPFYVEDNEDIDGTKLDLDDNLLGNRAKRHTGNEEKDKEKEGKAEDSEALPSAEAQTQEAGYYRRSRMSDDSLAQASGSESPGLRRVPRVNFVTQPRNLDDIPEHRDLKASTANVDPLYRRPPYDSYMPQSQYHRNMETRGRFYDTPYDRYDPMDRQRYDPYYQPRYPSQMYNNYYGGYYPESSRRYPDYPEMRKPYYPPQDPYMGGYPGGAAGGAMNTNRRVVYYATLPEVVRPTAPYGESRGGYYPPYPSRGGYYGNAVDDRYDDYYYQRNPYMDDYGYRYNRDMNRFGMPPMPEAPPSVIYSNSGNSNRLPERNDINKDKVSKDESKTQTISSNIRIKDSGSKEYGGYDSQGSRRGSASSSEFTQPHYRME